MKIEENKELEKNRKIKKVNVDGDFDNNLFVFIVEEKFKLLNYVYDYIDKMYEYIANFPRKHEIIKNKLIETNVF